MDDITDALYEGCGCMASPPVIITVIIMAMFTVLRLTGVIPDYWWQVW